MFKNRSKIVFAAAVLGTLYTIYLVSYFTSASSEDLGGAIATAIVMPHMAMNLLAVIFNWVAFAGTKKWAIIVALVLYCVAIVLFPLYALFDIPMVILSAIGISKTSKINKNSFNDNE